MAFSLLKAQAAQPVVSGSVAPTVTQGASCAGGTEQEHAKGLLLIGAFKLGKALLAILSGMAAYHWATVDLGQLAVTLISHVHIINPMGHLAQQLISRADDLDAHDIRRLGTLGFLLAPVYLAEGTGLMLRKVWAEYLTVILTAAAMPYEAYELARQFTGMKLAVLLVNAGVVLYLAMLLARSRRAACARAR